MNYKKASKSYTQTYKHQGQGKTQDSSSQSREIPMYSSAVKEIVVKQKEEPLYSSHVVAKNMSSLEMMQELLRGVGKVPIQQLVDQKDRENWGELLTNKYKMESYKKTLEK